MAIESPLHTNNGQSPIEEYVNALPESAVDEEINIVNKNISSFTRGNGTNVGIGKTELGLLKQMFHIPEVSDPQDVFLKLLPIANFKDDIERNKHIRAFDEAVRLGLDLWVNVRYLLSLNGVNRNQLHNNYAFSMMDTISHQKITTNYPTQKGKNSGNSRSPLST